MPIFRAMSITLCAVLFSACGSAQSNPRHEVLQRDSADVTIVETSGSIWDNAPWWTASAEPLVNIGAVEGSPQYLFSRVSGVVALSDGRVVVSDGGSNSLRWYDESGKYLFERGGSGEGPGEFSRIGPIVRAAGDTLVVTDSRLRRITEFSPDGDLVRTVPIEGITVPGPAQRLSDGTFIVGSTGFSSTQLTGEEEGLDRASEPLVRIGPGLEVPDTVGMFPGPEMYFTARSFGFHPFSRGFYYAVRGDLLFVAAAEGFVVDVYSPQGQLVRSIRAPEVDLRLTPEAVEEYKRGVREAATEQDEARAQATLEQLADMYFPEVRPAYGRLVAGDDELWLQEHTAGRVQGPSRWAIFGHNGEYRGTATIPVNFRLQNVRGDRLLGVSTDDLGVEYARIYALVEVDR